MHTYALHTSWMPPRARFVTDRDGDLTREPSRDVAIQPSRRPGKRRDDTPRTSVRALPRRAPPVSTAGLWLRVLLLLGTAVTFSLSALALAAAAVLVVCMLS